MILFFAILCIQAAGSGEPNAGEKEMISAGDILKNILSGNLETINNKIINGNLDLSSLDDLITADIKITNSVINGPVNFAGKTFGGQVDFSGTTFREVVTISNIQSITKFKKTVKFVDAHFVKDANFDRVWFDEGSDFNGAQFEGEALFRDANFIKGTKFENAQFHEVARFSCANFINSHVNFQNTRFEKGAIFYSSKFRSEVDRSETLFADAQFGGKAYFRNADFYDKANFQGSYFYKNADFRNANFAKGAVFEYAYFNEDALFNGADFSGKLNLNGSRFDRIQLSWRDIKGSDKLVYNDEVYLRLIESYRSQGLYKDADECYYNYRKSRISSLSLPFSLIDYSLLALYGYGVKLAYPVYWSIVVILISGYLFERRGRGDCPPIKAVSLSLKVFLSGTKPFSSDLVEFSKLEKKYRNIALVERFLGTLFFLLFLITLANTVIIK